MEGGSECTSSSDSVVMSPQWMVVYIVEEVAVAGAEIQLFVCLFVCFWCTNQTNRNSNGRERRC